MADVKFVRVLGGICFGSFSHVHGRMSDQKTGSYLGCPEFDSRSKEYSEVGLDTLIPVIIHHTAT
jgi:hypothetical protein